MENIELLLNRGAKVIHFSTCFCSYCPSVDELIEAVQQTYPNLQIEKRTHSGRLGWATIKDQYDRVIPKRQE